MDPNLQTYIDLVGIAGILSTVGSILVVVCVAMLDWPGGGRSGGGGSSSSSGRPASRRGSNNIGPGASTRANYTSGILFLGIADALGGIGAAMNLGQEAGSYPVPGPLCTVQGSLVQFSHVSSALWQGSLAFELFLTLTASLASSRSPDAQAAARRRFLIYHLVCWLVPTVILIVPLSMGYIGPAGMYCWIQLKPGFEYESWFMRWLSFYVIIFIMIVIVAALQIRTALFVHRTIFETSVGSEEGRANTRTAIRRMILFPIIFFCVWAPALTARVYSAITNEIPFGLYILLAFVHNSEGIWNALCYTMTNKTIQRRLCGDCKLCDGETQDMSWDRVRLQLTATSSQPPSSSGVPSTSESAGGGAGGNAV